MCDYQCTSVSFIKLRIESNYFSPNRNPLVNGRIQVSVITSVVVKIDLFRSRDRDPDLDKMNSSALESQDHGLQITTLVIT